jgi:predicted Zn finger-like uncharacterized protein
MHIVCPSCSAAYDVPEARLRPGRVVRCTRCGKEWSPVPEKDKIDFPEPAGGHGISHRPPPLPPTGPTAMDRLASQPRAPANGAGLRVAWLSSIAAVLALILALILAREPIMHAWPPSERLYNALGLTEGAPVPPK